MRTKLKFEALEVESFHTEEIPEERGTVHGHGTIRCSVNPEHTCAEATCQAVHTCMGETCTGCGTAWECTLYQTDDCSFYCPTGTTTCYPSQGGPGPCTI